MKIILFYFLILFALFNFQLKAQDSMLVNNHQLSLKVFGALVNGTPIMAGNEVLFVKQRPQVGISFSYQFFKNLNTALNVAYLNPYRAIPERDGGVTILKPTRSSAWYYGLSFSYDILPVIFNTNQLKFDVYPIISTNYVREKWIVVDSGILGSSIFWEFNGGIGLGYNFNKHVGIFTESLLGKFYNKDKFQLKAGLKYKF